MENSSHTHGGSHDKAYAESHDVTHEVTRSESHDVTHEVTRSESHDVTHEVTQTGPHGSTHGESERETDGEVSRELAGGLKTDCDEKRADRSSLGSKRGDLQEMLCSVSLSSDALLALDPSASTHSSSPSSLGTSGSDSSTRASESVDVLEGMETAEGVEAAEGAESNHSCEGPRHSFAGRGEEQKKGKEKEEEGGSKLSRSKRDREAEAVTVAELCPRSWHQTASETVRLLAIPVPRRSVSTVLSLAARTFPLPLKYGHLKRARCRPSEGENSVGGASGMSGLEKGVETVQVLVSTEEVLTEEQKLVLEKAGLQVCAEHVESVEVPANAPRSAIEAKRMSDHYWPVSYRKGRAGWRPSDPLTESDRRQIVKCSRAFWRQWLGELGERRGSGQSTESYASDKSFESDRWIRPSAENRRLHCSLMANIYYRRTLVASATNQSLQHPPPKSPAPSHSESEAIPVSRSDRYHLLAHAPMEALWQLSEKVVRLNAQKKVRRGKPKPKDATNTAQGTKIEKDDEEVLEATQYYGLDCDVYLLGEPCMMCAMALAHSRVARLVMVSKPRAQPHSRVDTHPHAQTHTYTHTHCDGKNQSNTDVNTDAYTNTCKEVNSDGNWDANVSPDSVDRKSDEMPMRGRLHIRRLFRNTIDLNQHMTGGAQTHDEFTLCHSSTTPLSKLSDPKSPNVCHSESELDSAEEWDDFRRGNVWQNDRFGGLGGLGDAVAVQWQPALNYRYPVYVALIGVRIGRGKVHGAEEPPNPPQDLTSLSLPPRRTSG